MVYRDCTPAALLDLTKTTATVRLQIFRPALTSFHDRLRFQYHLVQCRECQTRPITSYAQIHTHNVCAVKLIGCCRATGDTTLNVRLLMFRYMRTPIADILIPPRQIVILLLFVVPHARKFMNVHACTTRVPAMLGLAIQHHETAITMRMHLPFIFSLLLRGIYSLSYWGHSSERESRRPTGWHSHGCGLLDHFVLNDLTPAEHI
ncbi:uncharacterized protein EDB91DRAFT_4560 [Suillus paluster]|uniref:uncharacterized protein n=1 Tax=Suillus paluster TaxID=48578 RepID=UPI001B874517|nr:uncharacterized protein EDB91DRAFT_4560 [Suillus paluster]KAG1756274.1 hypothetical protein EDB91DRAFT_4560 [Suillus paluster]